MGVFRVEKTKNYTVMSNVHLRDKELSLKAKGLLSLMLSLPDDWDYTLRGLAAINKESINTISAIVNELIDHGYIIRQQIRGTAGRFGDIDYLIFESRQEMEEYMRETDSLQENSAGIFTEEKDVSYQTQENDLSGSEDKNSVVLKNAEQEKKSPCHKNCDTAETLENGGLEPCHKKPYTETRDTDFCDANKILNKQNTNITNNLSIHPKDNNKTYVEFYEQMLEQIKQNIGYDILSCDRSDEIGLIDTIVDTIMDVMLTPKDEIVHVGSRDRPVSLVQARFIKLQMEHVTYVMDCVNNTTSKIANIRAYLRTSLYNAPDSMQLFYHNWVMHDMASPDHSARGVPEQPGLTGKGYNNKNVPTVGTQGG